MVICRGGTVSNTLSERQFIVSVYDGLDTEHVTLSAAGFDITAGGDLVLFDKNREPVAAAQASIWVSVFPMRDEEGRRNPQETSITQDVE